MKINSIKISKFGLDTIWLLLGQAMAMGAGLFLNLYVGYKYGTSSLGVFNQSLAYYLIFSTLFALGLNNALIKKISEKTRSIEEEKKLFTGNLITSILISSTLASILIIVLFYLPNLLSSIALAEALPSMLYALPLFTINKNFVAYYSGNRKQKRVAFQRIYRWGSISILFFTGGVFDYSITQLMYSFLLVEGSLAIINVSLNVNNFNFHISYKLIKDSIVFGMGSYISEITSTFNNSIDIIIVAYFLTEQEAGQYSFIAFFVRTLYVFPGILMQNISPIISFYWMKKEIKKLNIKLKKLRKINLILLTLQFMFLLGLYKFIIIKMTHGFESTYVAFIIALIGTFLFAQISWGGSILIMTEKLKANFKRTLIVLVINIIVCTILSASLGFIGSASAISLNAILSFMLLKTFVYRQTGIRLI